MMFSGWEDLLWLMTVGFELCLNALVIVAGVLALRCQVKVVGVLLLVGGILSIFGTLGGTICQFQFRIVSWSGSSPDYEMLSKLMEAMYGVGTLGHLLEVVGLLLVVLAFRSRWVQANQLAALPPH
jgi:hypothetical protein